MKTLLRISLLCALLASVVGWVGGGSPAAAQNAAYTDTMDSEADGLLSTVSPDPAIVSFAYQDGTFVVQAPNQAAPKEILTDIKTPSMDGTQVLFDVSISGDTNLKYVVAGCRAGPGHSGYQLAVDLDTAEATLRSRDGEFSEVLDRTEAPAALNTGAAMNQIGIECEGTRISAIVNGVTVLTAFDTVYTDGYSYLGVGSKVGATGGLTATFDNLTVADLGTSGFEHPAGQHQPTDPVITAQDMIDPLVDPGAAMVQTWIMSVMAPPTAGPLQGNLELNAGEAAEVPLGVQLEEFYAEIRFVTPQPTQGGLWSYGFCFWTDPASGSCTDLFIQSDGATATWGWGGVLPTGEYMLIESGDMPAGSIDLTPGAENIVSILVYNSSAILGINGQVAATFRLTAQPFAGDVAERVEFDGSDQSGTQTITLSTLEFAAWDMSDYPLVNVLDAAEDDAQSIEQRACRLTRAGDASNSHCAEEGFE